MKHFLITVLALICSFWGFYTLDHHRLNAPEAVKNLLHELDEQNQTDTAPWLPTNADH